MTIGAKTYESSLTTMRCLLCTQNTGAKAAQLEARTDKAQQRAVEQKDVKWWDVHNHLEMIETKYLGILIICFSATLTLIVDCKTLGVFLFFFGTRSRSAKIIPVSHISVLNHHAL